jgi:hypothetical protein
MDRRSILALLVALVGISLVGSPLTMADWGEQAHHSTERIERTDVDSEIPILRYENLSNSAQNAVRRAIESPDGDHTVYGREDWPDRFFYSDYAAPGQGRYAVVYEGQYYRLETYAGGGFPFVYWLYELPFVVYGLVLGGVAAGTYRGAVPTGAASFATALGVAFHLLGPEFDFPLVAPMQFVALGAVGTVVVGLVWLSTRNAGGPEAE